MSDTGRQQQEKDQDVVIGEESSTIGLEEEEYVEYESGFNEAGKYNLPEYKDAAFAPKTEKPHWPFEKE